MSVGARVLVLVVVVVAVAVLLVFTRQPGRTEGLRGAFDAEFMVRPDGYQVLKEHYSFEFPLEPKQMDPGLMYRALADGSVDVIDGFATDGRIPAYDLVVLEDDKNFFPPYYAAPLVRVDKLKEHPELGKILNRLGGQISDHTMQKLNYEVDDKGRKAYDVARAFLVSRQLIPADAVPGSGSAGIVAIGGKHFTEQEILGEIMAILIECTSDLGVDRRLNLGGTIICFNALKAADIDLYAEYTGTGLVNILKKEVVSDPDSTYRTVKQEFLERYDLVWLEPFGFNNTYTLTMRREHARQLGIETISDLAQFMNESAE